MTTQDHPAFRPPGVAPPGLVPGAVMTTTKGLTRHRLQRWELVRLSTGGRAAIALCGVAAGDQEAVDGHAQALMKVAWERYAVAYRSRYHGPRHPGSARDLHRAVRRLARAARYLSVRVETLPPCGECDTRAEVITDED